MTGILVLRGAYYGAQWGGLISLAVYLPRYCLVHQFVCVPLVLPVAGSGGEKQEPLQNLYLWLSLIPCPRA